MNTTGPTVLYKMASYTYLHPTLLADDIGEDNMKKPGFTLDIWGSSPADYWTGPNFYGCWLNPVKSACGQQRVSISSMGKWRLMPSYPKETGCGQQSGCSHVGTAMAIGRLVGK